MKEKNEFNLGLKNVWEVVCYDSNGAEKWREKNKNLVTTEGLNHVLSITLDGGTQITTWYVGLAGAGTKAAADTMSSHSGWAVIAAYSESVRQTLTLGTASAGSIDTSASPCTGSDYVLCNLAKGEGMLFPRPGSSWGLVLASVSAHVGVEILEIGT